MLSQANSINIWDNHVNCPLLNHAGIPQYIRIYLYTFHHIITLNSRSFNQLFKHICIYYSRSKFDVLVTLLACLGLGMTLFCERPQSGFNL